jgi:hypothetical protein
VSTGVRHWSLSWAISIHSTLFLIMDRVRIVVGLLTVLSEVFRCFSEFLQANVGIMSLNQSWPVYSRSLFMHHSLSSLEYNQNLNNLSISQPWSVSCYLLRYIFEDGLISVKIRHLCYIEENGTALFNVQYHISAFLGEICFRTKKEAWKSIVYHVSCGRSE